VNAWHGSVGSSLNRKRTLFLVYASGSDTMRAWQIKTLRRETIAARRGYFWYRTVVLDSSPANRGWSGFPSRRCTMRIRSARFLALVLAVGFVLPLFAQRPGGRMGGGGVNASMLLTQKSVQEEIKMTEDQIAKVDKIGKDLRDKYADDLKDKDKRQETMKKMNDERTKALADVLKPEQMKRVKQIEIQLGGLNALAKEKRP
jgi:hypothetical protein